MTKFLILNAVILGTLLSASCSNARDATKGEVQAEASQEHVQESPKQVLSAADQAISDDYAKLVKKLNGQLIGDERRNQYKAFIPKAQQIKNKQERERILYRIYQAAQMDKELVDLIAKQQEEDYDPKRLIIYCEYMYAAKLPKKQIQQCHLEFAKYAKEELDKIPKSNPLRINAEYLYHLEMYKAGYVEHKARVEKLIANTTDKQTKDNFQSVYELAIKQGY